MGWTTGLACLDQQPSILDVPSAAATMCLSVGPISAKLLCVISRKCRYPDSVAADDVAASRLAGNGSIDNRQSWMSAERRNADGPQRRANHCSAIGNPSLMTRCSPPALTHWCRRIGAVSSSLWSRVYSQKS